MLYKKTPVDDADWRRTDILYGNPAKYECTFVFYDALIQP
jgi:hypothetical protein